ncbi:MAG: hypothetical protein JOZ05_08855 [Acetobacteraceae bacterium]|nr:hypothetical protein [Acetobacteraceae bacterium]
MRIVFHGENAASFREGFETLVPEAEIAVVSEVPRSGPETDAYQTAEVLVATRFGAGLPRPERLRLLHLPAAGYDGIDFGALPPGALVCNCFGHEHAIAEYVMAALLRRTVPLEDADQRLRRGEWAYWAGTRGRLHAELGGSTIGLLGFGHIGKAVATRARAFGMRVHAANRSAVEGVDRYFPLSELGSFWSSADHFVVTLPLIPETRGIVGAEAFRAMRPHAVLINVARGPVVDEQALYDALRGGRIAGAVIDTWYRYPSAEEKRPMPGHLPFHDLPNVLMTPHMSGWTLGTITRRQRTIAENIGRRWRGEPCLNVLHGS